MIANILGVMLEKLRLDACMVVEKSEDQYALLAIYYFASMHGGRVILLAIKYYVSQKCCLIQ